MVIVLDPGHGGSDPGSSKKEYGLIEKELNLKVATYCKEALEKDTSIKVYMTRYTDEYVGLEERVKIAKDHNATLFVSIHMNSADSEAAKGAEVYYPNKNGTDGASISEEGKEVAQNILDELVNLGLVGRGVKTKDSSYDKDDRDCR